MARPAGTVPVQAEPASPNLPRKAALLMVVLLSAAAGAAVATAGPTALIAVLALALILTILRWPVIPLLIILLVGSVGGRLAAHVLVPPIGVPILETLLGAAAVAAAGHMLVADRSLGVSVRPLLLWAPAAAWGAALLVLNNHADLISGAREAVVFMYPFLLALPLSISRPPSYKAFLERSGPLWVLAAAVVVCIGLYNTLTGNSEVTSTGQTRTLTISYAPVVVTSALVGLWHYKSGRWRSALTLAAIGPLAAFFIINFRSAYLALVAAFLAYAWMQVATPQASTSPASGRLTRLAFPVVTLLLIFLIATPVGRAGLERLSTITDRDDPNIAFRFEQLSEVGARPVNEQILGSGVGLRITNLSQPVEDIPRQRDDTHNSYATLLRYGGAIGLALILVPLLLSLRAMVRRRHEPIIQVLVGLAVFTLVLAAFNVVWENLYLGAWCWVPLILGDRLARDLPAREGGH